MAQANYIAQKAWNAIHFVMHVFKVGNRNRKSSAYTSLVCTVLEYGGVCWDPYSGQKHALDRVQAKAAQCTNHTKDSDWETLALRCTTARL